MAQRKIMHLPHHFSLNCVKTENNILHLHFVVVQTKAILSFFLLFTFHIRERGSSARKDTSPVSNSCDVYFFF